MNRPRTPPANRTFLDLTGASTLNHCKLEQFPVTDKIKLTAAATAMVIQLQSADTTLKDQCLRLYLDGKGCDGFFYGVSFDSAQEGDQRFPQTGFDLIVDPETLAFVQGSTIDWVDDERGRGFLVENPNHKKFRGKFFKRTDWQKRLGATLDP